MVHLWWLSWMENELVLKKLLKELDPLSDGWDGTFLGNPMPQTDYWFKVLLQDGRELKGHFSLIRGW